ncbi:MAG: DUF937 domain-containing protein [Brachymonas denitrificans]|uniref:DUF937 domain-containing protein n=1 Tax=Brachymonas denitrificans TaxID=28220 RepID=UPI001BCBE024|nr:DUF937 domain-containing protein [Brachymonas denitrificans]
MNNSIVDELLGQLQGPLLGQIAGQLGTDNSQTQNAITAAIPMIVGALGRNAQTPQGADDLFGALQRDHVPAAGGVDLGGLLGSLLGGGAAMAPARQMDGGGILGHIFGGAQPRAEAGLGQATGIGSDKSAQLLKILAPIVMAFLAKKVMAGGMNSGSLGGMLGQERAQVQQQGGLGGTLMNAVLDQDGDGQVGLGDLLKMGATFLGGRR